MKPGRRVWSCSEFTILVAGALVPPTCTHRDRAEEHGPHRVSSCTRSLSPPQQQAEGAVPRTGAHPPHEEDVTLLPISPPRAGGPPTPRDLTVTFPDTSHPDLMCTHFLLHPFFSPSCCSLFFLPRGYILFPFPPTVIPN